MKDLINAFLKYLFLPVLLAGYSYTAGAFSCIVVDTGQVLSSGTANVYVNLQPSIGIGQNLVIDLSSSINCKNDSVGEIIIDYVTITNGSAYGGAIAAFTGSLYWNSNTYALPMVGDSATYTITFTSYRGLPLQLYLTAMGAAGGIAINSGEMFAVLRMHKVASDDNPVDFTWNIFANNSVVVPTGGCDVSSRDVAVTLPDYPGAVPVPLTIQCAQSQNLAYYLTGTTTDAASTIFTNTASAPAAQGVGIQLSNNNGIIATNNSVSMGTVGTSPVSLGLTATYAQTTGQIVAGNIKSVVGVTFLYP